MPRGSRQPPATLTPGWPLAGQRSSAAAACARARPGQVRDRRSPARLRTTSAGSPPASDLQGHRRASADETEVTGQTGGHQPAGRRTGGHQPAGQPDPGRPNQMTGHRTAGHRTAGQPDPGRGNRMVGHPMVDTDRRRTAWQVLAFPTAATTPYRWGAVRKLGRSDAAWSISSQDSSAERTLPRRGWATATTRQRQGDTPPSSRRLGALLSSNQMGGE